MRNARHLILFIGLVVLACFSLCLIYFLGISLSLLFCSLYTAIFNLIN